MNTVHDVNRWYERCAYELGGEFYLMTAAGMTRVTDDVKVVVRCATALYARSSELLEDLRVLEEQLARKTLALAEAERELAERRAP